MKASKFSEAQKALILKHRRSREWVRSINWNFPAYRGPENGRQVKSEYERPN